MSRLYKEDNIFGKTDAKLPWERYKEQYREDDKYVIATNKKLTRIEDIPLQDRVVISETSKTPLIQNGEVVGVLGIYFDITAEKEAEQLRLENEAHKAELQAQESFTKIAAQVAHDIKSPTASLLMLLKSCQEDIPEKETVALREATMRIQDIANNLLNYYLKDNKNAEVGQTREPLLASALILELIGEKKLQYQDLSISFKTQFSQNGHFAFINVDASAIKRMLSNLINNSVDACENKHGQIYLFIDATNEWVKIIIEDNGKGMGPSLVEKINNRLSVSEGKKNGHGLGLVQVREALQDNIGTKIVLTFPRVKASTWIAEEIRLRPQDNIIIVDDDSSIHNAWDAHFETILDKDLGIQVKHFTVGAEALDFIKSLADEEKDRVVLLSDYELLKQNLNGLDIIEQAGITRSILVTSHYTNQKIRKRTEKIGTRLLPKLLASETPIIIEKSITERSKPTELIIIDDNPMFLELFALSFSKRKRVEGFHNPHHFLRYLGDYSKDKIICFDYDFNLSDIDGLKLAEKLHNAGYNKLYMISGMNFSADQLPSYLTLVDKGDMSILDKL